MKKLFVCLMVALLALPSLAEQLTADQSLARLAAMQGRAQHVKSLNKSGLRLAYTAQQKGENLYYVFDRTDEGGYMILGADDLAPELIGYTNTGRFDADHVVPALKWWLSECELSISRAIAAGKPLKAAAKHAKREDIAPLVKSLWSQSGNYNGNMLFNKYCPKVDGQATPVGCMATAMAQIMRYHQWPEKGSGSVSYTTLTHQKNLSVDFSKTTYKWSDMIDKYGNVYGEDGKVQSYSFTDAQNDAVSLLSYHCGVATEMDYAPEGSGTGVLNALSALITNFGYSPYTYLTNRDFYENEQWEALLYSELEAERPILYTGYTKNEEGHAFVVDGYKDGLFHVNWGWGGLSDGYYTVFGNDALHPMKQGVGGSAVCDAFLYGHYVILNFAKPADITDTSCHFVTEGQFTIDNFSKPGENFNDGDVAHVSLPFGFFNFGGQALKVRLGLRLTNVETGAVCYLQDAYPQSTTINSLSGISEYHVYCDNVPDGVYNAVPAVKLEGDEKWTDALLSPGVQAVTMVYGNAEAPEEKKDDAELFCSEVVIKDKDGNNERTINVELQNPGNIGNDQFKGYVTLALFDDNDEFVALLDESQQYYSIASYLIDSKPLQISAVIPASVGDGHYYVYPVAFQKGSENWCTFFGYDPNLFRVSFDPVDPIQIWLTGNKVSYTEDTTGVSNVNDNENDNVNYYDLQGRNTTRQKQNSHIYIIRSKENSQKVW